MGTPPQGARRAWKRDRFLPLTGMERQAAKRFLTKALNGFKA
jgi:hypothetical protein